MLGADMVLNIYIIGDTYNMSPTRVLCSFSNQDDNFPS
jgi:hypothetical protein